MLRRSLLASVCGALLALFAFSCAGLRSDYPLPLKHPEDVGKGPPVCTECHEGKGKKAPIDYAWLNHSPSEAQTHRKKAYGNERVCAMCHPQSFCDDCHGVRVELKPSLKNQTETYRGAPHRGDYLSRHQIDGRVDPTSCFRCHGNPKTSHTCTPCHG